MPIRHFLSVSNLGVENLSRLVDRSLAMASEDGRRTQPLKGKIVGIYFRRSSTRTRTAFTVGALRLGASVIAYGPNDLQIVTGETISDTARVLAGFLDGLVIRTNDPIAEMEIFAGQNQMAVINAMSENEHPTQAIADLVTLREEFGRLNDIHVLYLGEGNNTVAALALAVSQTPGMQLTVLTPEGYGLDPTLLEEAASLAEKNGARVEQHHDMKNLPNKADAVYATRWQTMGVPKADPNWLELFAPYQVTPEIMSRVSKPSGTIFMHDLPAVRGGDVLDEVIDGPQSRAFRQAQHKLSSAMAILESCLADKQMAASGPGSAS
jgi:ornithine carbamoyltransferase